MSLQQLEGMAIQELRQALRERGANCRGSKKQLIQRLAEQYSSEIAGAEQKSVAKVRVSVQKSRNEACMILLDPSLPPEHSLQSLLDKARFKFRFRPTHLYVIGTAAQGGGVELNSENVRHFLKDGLVVLASTTAKHALDPHAYGGTHNGGSPVPQPRDQEEGEVVDMAQLALAEEGPTGARADSSSSSPQTVTAQRQQDMTDSGSCSSEMEEHADADHQSVKSFDSESLYSFSGHGHPPRSRGHSTHSHTSDEEHKNSDGTAAPGLGYSRSQHDGSHSSGSVSRPRKGWRKMLPQSMDQPLKPPAHPASPGLRPVAVQSVQTSPLISTAHVHRNHRCAMGAAASASASAAAASPAAPCSSSSSSAAAPALPSIMDELYATGQARATSRRTSVGGSCECCDAGCEIDFASRSTSPVPTSSLTRAASSPPIPLSASPSPSVTSTASAAAASASSASAAAPAHPPSLSSSHSISSLDSLRRLEDDNRRLTATAIDLEKRNRRLDSSLKSLLKSDTELRAQVSRLHSGSSRAQALEEEFRTLRLNLETKEKECTKSAWERDRLKAKQQALMTRNNELKADSEALAVLKKEHHALQQTYARLNGQHVNASTSPAVLQELLLLHATAIERVHAQMAANIAREKQELKEKQQCKICMSRPCDTILLPCSHFVLCGHCASSVSKCPICRRTAEDKRPVYM